MRSSPDQLTPESLVQDVFDRVRLDPSSSRPLYLQLTEQLRTLIDAGALASGQNLPAERVLAERLKVSRTTVKHCYDELRRLSVLSTHGRGGTVVHVPPRL